MTPATLLSALFGVLVMGAATTQADPTITYISTDQIVDIGDTAQLRCTVANAGDHSVAWIKADSSNPEHKRIISTNNVLLIQDARYQVTVDTVNASYHLQIKDILDTDHGSYQCQVELSQTDRISAEVKLLVRSPPSFLPNSTSSVTVTEGGSVNLQCYVKGYPEPHITWNRDNYVGFYAWESNLSNNVLNLQNITKRDRGLYFCVADNGVGKKVKHSVEVNVKFAPIISASRERVKQALQHNADLECNVESYPTAAIYWLRNETILYASAKYTTSTFSTPKGHVSSVLRIVQVEPDDYGTYICNAANELGSSHALVELSESQYPVCPPACNVRLIEVKNGTSRKVNEHI